MCACGGTDGANNFGLPLKSWSSPHSAKIPQSQELFSRKDFVFAEAIGGETEGIITGTIFRGDRDDFGLGAEGASGSNSGC